MLRLYIQRSALLLIFVRRRILLLLRLFFGEGSALAAGTLGIGVDLAVAITVFDDVLESFGEALFAGPLGNYLFASVLFFVAFWIGGDAVSTTRVKVMKDGAAQAAQMKNGDQIVRIGKTKIDKWEQIPKLIRDNSGKALEIGVLRDKQPVTLKVTPRPKQDGKGGIIGVQSMITFAPVSVQAAAVRSVVLPARVVRDLVVGLVRIVTGKEKPQLTGPVGIVKVTSRAAAESWTTYLYFLGVLSAYLGGFNLVPFPALDGGRLMFLSYEAVTRRRPNARIEAQIHAVGVLILLALIAVVSVFDIRGN